MTLPLTIVRQWRTIELVKVRDVIKAIESDGWKFHSQKGSHRQYKHAEKAGRVTVAGKPGDDVHPKTLATIFKQAQLSQSEE